MVVDDQRLGRKEPNLIIIGVDYHPSDQYIAFADTETGECGERRLSHSDGEAEKFYRDLQQRATSVRVGMEATGYSRLAFSLLAFSLPFGDGLHPFADRGLPSRKT